MWHAERMSGLVIVERRRRADGQVQLHPAGGRFDPADRAEAIMAAHRFRCGGRMSYRAVQAALSESGFRVSLGTLVTWIRDHQCEFEDG